MSIATQEERLRKLFDEEKALAHFKTFYTATNKELMACVHTNSLNDVHKLSTTDVATDNKVGADLTDIEHI